MTVNTTPQVTDFMKSLTVKQHADLLSEINQSIKKAQAGINKIRNIIARDRKSDLYTFVFSRFPQNDFKHLPSHLFWMDDTVSSGYNFRLPEKVKPSNTALSQIVSAYNSDIKQMNDVGSKTVGKLFENSGDLNSDRKILVVNDESILIENFRNVYFADYNAQPIKNDIDPYTLRAFGRYLWEYLYNTKTGYSSQANKYIDSLRISKLDPNAKPIGVHDFETFIYRTVIGRIALLTAIRDKLQNYTPGADEVSSNPLVEDQQDAQAAELRGPIYSVCLKGTDIF